MSDFQVVTATLTTSIETQDITIPGFGTPVAALCFFGGDADGVQRSDGGVIGFGMTDGTDEYATCVASKNAVTTTVCSRLSKDGILIGLIDPATGAFEVEAAFNAWITDGIQINITNAPTSTRTVTFVLIKNCTVKQGYISALTASDEVVTGIGFSSDIIFTANTAKSQAATVEDAASTISLGVALADETQRQASISDTTALTTTKVNCLYSDIYAGVEVYDDSLTWGGTIKDIGSDGFTVEPSANGGNDSIPYLCVKLASGKTAKLSTVDGPTAAGNHQVSGIGHKPVFGFMITADASAVNSLYPSRCGMSVLAFDAANQAGVCFGSKDNVGTSVAASEYNAGLTDYTNGTTDLHVGTVKQLDSNGLTLDFPATVPAGARKWALLTIGDEPADQATMPDFQVVTATLNTSTGTQDITIPGFGTPVAALCFYGGDADGVQRTDGSAFGYGITDGTNEYSSCAAMKDAVSPTVADRGLHTSFISSIKPDTSALEYQADFSAWITDGIRINVTTAPSDTRTVTIILIRNCSAYAARRYNSGQTSIDITGVGFLSDVIFFLEGTGRVSAATIKSHSQNSIGVALRNDDQRALSVMASSGLTTSVSRSRIGTDGAMVAITGYANSYSLAVSDVDSDGFTLTASQALWVDFPYLCLKLPAGQTAKLKSVDGPTAAGNHVISGVGHKPDFAFMFLSDAVAENSDDIINSSGLAAYDGSTQASCSVITRHSVNPSVAASEYNAALHDLAGDKTDLHVGTFSSLNGNGITLNFPSTVPAAARKWALLTIGTGSGEKGLIKDYVNNYVKDYITDYVN